MQIARISGNNIKVNNNNYCSSYKKTNNTVNYQQNNTVLYNTMPDMVPFTANEPISQENTPKVKPIQETLDERYPDKPLAVQLIRYHKDLIEERKIGLEKLNEIRPQVDKRIKNAGEIIESILTENGIQVNDELFTVTHNIGNNLDEKIAKRKYQYTLVSEQYPGAKLTISSTCRTLDEMRNSTFKGSRIEEFRSDALVLKRKEDKYFTGYRLNCDLLGNTGWGFIFPEFDDKKNKFEFEYGNLVVETPVGLFSGNSSSAKNSTTNVTYSGVDSFSHKRLRIEQSVKNGEVEEKIFCIDPGDDHTISELTYTVHQSKDDTKNYTVETQTVIRKKEDK